MTAQVGGENAMTAEEETALVTHINYMAERNFPYDVHEIKLLARLLCTNPDFTASDGWYGSLARPQSCAG